MNIRWDWKGGGWLYQGWSEIRGENYYYQEYVGTQYARRTDMWDRRVRWRLCGKDQERT